MAFSSSLVVTIMAIVWSTLKESSAFLAEVRESKAFLASSWRPLRTSHLWRLDVFGGEVNGAIPRRFGGEEDADHDWDWPDPLNCLEAEV